MALSTRLGTSLLGEQTGIDADFKAARAVFALAVLLECGFLLGTTGMSLIIEVMLNVPVVYSEFIRVAAVDVVVCYLIVRTYDGLNVARCGLEGEVQEQTEDSKLETPYIAIV